MAKNDNKTIQKKTRQEVIKMTNCHRCKKCKQTTNRNSFRPQTKEKARW
jgi:hypothetical protein